MKINEEDRKYIIAMLTSNYQTLRIQLKRYKELLEAIENNACSDKQWQELYFRFLKDE